MLASLSAVRQLPQLPKTKVCGVTLSSDLLFLGACKVEAIGFNLVPTSKRHLSLADAVELATQTVKLGMLTTAVVMDPTEAELASITSAFPWDMIQLHGSEAPGISEYCNGIAIIKAVSWSGRLQEAELVDQWSQYFGGSLESSRNCDTTCHRRLLGFLLDAYSPGQGGGSGRQARWDLLYPRPKSLEKWPILLAGGLNAGNVYSAIHATRCNGVDTASGVEIGPGIKSEELVVRFMAEAHRGFAAIYAR